MAVVDQTDELLKEVAKSIHALLDAVDSGQISALLPAERDVLRQLQGALKVLQELAPAEPEPFMD